LNRGAGRIKRCGVDLGDFGIMAACGLRKLFLPLLTHFCHK
jgi:hypothetical protein